MNTLYGRLAGRFLLLLGAFLLMIWCVIGAVAVWYTLDHRPAAAGGTDPAAVLRGLPAATTVAGGHLVVAPAALAAVTASGGWLQVLDAGGAVVYSFGAPAALPAQYAPGLLVYDRLNPEAFGYQLGTWYGQAGDRSLTWLLGLPLGQGAPVRGQTYRYVLGLAGGTVLAALLTALLFGRQLGRPVVHMMRWLQELARGSYAEPADRRGLPRSRTAGGALRRPYGVYREVLEALQALATTLREREGDRQRLEQSREAWLAGISHDLRTPLSSVRGYADMLAAETWTWSEAEARRFGQIIADRAVHMDGLIEDLALTLRLRHNALVLDRVPVDVVELARAVTIDLVNSSEAAGQSVEFACSAEVIAYPLDARWFTRALDNLVRNASRHNPPGTTITVAVEGGTADGGRYPPVRIRIADDGQGMDQDTLTHLFDRYHRGTNTARSAAGSGLGCAIARQLIEAHGGQVCAESTFGQGTVVVIALPRQP